eukprot:scaffold69559_cov54-Phaeocystis_antarctica.AAC.3
MAAPTISAPTAWVVKGSAAPPHMASSTRSISTTRPSSATLGTNARPCVPLTRPIARAVTATTEFSWAVAIGSDM